MSESIQTELVNFSMLEEAATQEQREELTRNVVNLYSLTSATCSKEQMDIYDAVLMRLADLVSDDGRTHMVKTLSKLRRAPEAVVLKLAGDITDVARPLLEKSTILRDADLIDIAKSRSEDHMYAIVGRDVLVDKGGKQVKRRLAGNHGAAFSDQSVNTLLHAAEDDQELQLNLGLRGDLHDDYIVRLIAIASEKVRRRLVEQGEGGTASRIPQDARLAAQRMSNEYWLESYDFETAQEVVLDRFGRNGLSEQLLRRFAEEDRFPEAVVTFACLAGIGLSEAMHWMVRVDTQPFVVMARACGLTPMTVQVLLKIDPWWHRLSADMRMETFNRFHSLNRDKARRMIALWRDQRMAS
ncbi:DUF2336 domain-containing protein [Breoghania sp.]|uniref:DUF2336 domain-containing protein n=1 Tax=Breoghania sp. TaxID=2065378 RepID=UPI0026277D32|nr:DUF2336 domain-containing protein [Breoghania sp.]MDJ0931469.1 DUF2336 domain-containing protein [Breoghania sp.]